jgi:hypothetical protein
MPMTKTAADDSDDAATNKKRKRLLLSEAKRKERNAREQERSNRITQQFEELRTIVQAADATVKIPKGTKSAILAAAMDCIQRLQEREQTMTRYVYIYCIICVIVVFFMLEGRGYVPTWVGPEGKNGLRKLKFCPS